MQSLEIEVARKLTISFSESSIMEGLTGGRKLRLSAYARVQDPPWGGAAPLCLPT